MRWSRLSALLALIGAVGCGEVILPDASVDGGFIVDVGSPPDMGISDSGSDGDAGRPDTGVDAGHSDASRLSLRVGRAGLGLGSVTSNPAGITCGASCEATFAVDEMVTLTAAADPGSTFGGWSGDCRGLALTCELTLDRARTATAAFDQREVSLSISPAGTGGGRVRSDVGAIDCPGVCTQSYAIGTNVALTASPDPTSVFDGWADDPVCSGAGPCTVPMTAAHAITAIFTRITHRVSITKSGPGLGTVTSAGGQLDCGATCTADLVTGTQVELTATPDGWSRFARWTGACTGSNPTCAVTADAARTVDAVFEIRPNISAGGFHTCALLETGAIRCWGANQAGQLGYGSTTPAGDQPSTTPAMMGDVPLGAIAIQVSAGANHTCALIRGGAVRCWGNNASGQLGYGHIMNLADAPATTPDLNGDVPLGGPALQIAAGFDHTCALLATGNVRCWGSSEYGQLGYGSSTPTGHTPGTVPANLANVPLGDTATQLATGTHHTCALLSTRNVRCWGRGEAGRLGYGAATNIGDRANSTPATAGDVPIGAPVAEVAGFGAHTCARLVSGAVRCWGLGLDGRLGYGNTNDIGAVPGSTPAAAGDVMLGANATQIAAGWVHSCALISSGAVRCWGYSFHGELGYGSQESVADSPGESPAAAGDVPIGGAVSRISVGSTHMCALLVSGAVRCWGEGTAGRLGYGNSQSLGEAPTRTPALNGDVPLR